MTDESRTVPDGGHGEPRVVADTRCHTGEGCLYHPDEEVVYFLDIPRGDLYRYDPAEGSHERVLDDDVVMRPDHVPTMAGEDNSNPGYHTKGRLFAIGYMRGLREQVQAED